MSEPARSRPPHGDWEPPQQTAFDKLSSAQLDHEAVAAYKPEKPKSKMLQFSEDIVPAALAIGLAILLVSGAAGLGVRLFIWAAGL